MISLLSYLKKELICLDLDVQSKDDLFSAMTTKLAGHLGLSGNDSLMEAIRNRESAMSTGIGEGIAIPHAKNPMLEEVVIAFARTKDPLEYEALDSKPVRLVFMLMGPTENASLHVKVLARLARMLKNPEMKQGLLDCETADECVAVIQGQEAPSSN